MLKRVLILLILTGMPVFAAENYLNSVVLSQNDGRSSVILRTDYLTKVKKNAESSDKMLITLKNIKQSGGVTTLYKNMSDVNGFIIQNDKNDLKIYINAKDISKSDIIFETPNSAPVKAVDTKTEEKLLWTLVSIIMMLGIMLFVRNTDKPKKIDKAKLIKEREIELYRNFQKEVSTLPNINYKLKGYRKHVLKGETIRSYENRTANKV